MTDLRDRSPARARGAPAARRRGSVSHGAAQAVAVAVVCMVALIAHGLLWELWLAPVRPGGSMLALKVLPLVALLPGVVAGRTRSLQWLSLAILLYVGEGALRASSDMPSDRWLGAVELALALACFAATVLAVRWRRLAASAAGAVPSDRTPPEANRKS